MPLDPNGSFLWADWHFPSAAGLDRQPSLLLYGWARVKGFAGGGSVPPLGAGIAESLLAALLLGTVPLPAQGWVSADPLKAVALGKTPKSGDRKPGKGRGFSRVVDRFPVLTARLGVLLARGRIYRHRARRISGAVEICGHGHSCALVHIASQPQPCGIERDFVVLVVTGINQCQHPRMQVQKDYIPAEHKCASRSCENRDVAGYVLASAVGLKMNRDQRSFPQLTRGRFLALADNRSRGRDVQLNGLRGERITHQQFAVSAIVAEDLTLTFSFWQVRQHVDAAGKDRRSIQHGLNRHVVSGTQISKRGFLAITVNLGTFVEENFHRMPAEDIQGELVADAVHLANRSADDGALSSGHGRQVRKKNCRAFQLGGNLIARNVR